MAFIRIEKKKSGNYMRIVESFRENGKPKNRTLYSLGKVEDYTSEQLQKIAEKLLEVAGLTMEEIVPKNFTENRRLNYGYALVIKKLWRLFDMDKLTAILSTKKKVRFDWINALQLMIAERINEPRSKRSNFLNSGEYIGFNTGIELQHLYRTLDILSDGQEQIKEHLFKTGRNLFTQELDVVFYDVTTLYFDSQKEEDGSLRKKGYSKDGKAHKTQVVLGLLVDKLRNPVTYNIYQGNTYEGATMIDALKQLKEKYTIDRVIVVADSGMIDKDNRNYIVDNELDYILGDRIKNLPKNIKEVLLDKSEHKAVSKNISKEKLSYTEVDYQGRRIICTWSEKRAKKDAYEREKLLKKAQEWISTPSKYKQVKKRGAGRFINTDEQGYAISINQEIIEQDSKYDGFKAIATTTKLKAEELLKKYGDLYNVEHSFRTLKSQLEIRPMFHWTNKRIEGHIAMCFIAYTFLNYLRNTTGLQNKEIVKTLDLMQMSEIKENENEEFVYMRSKVNENQKIIFKKLKIVTPNDLTPQKTINQLFN